MAKSQLPPPEVLRQLLRYEPEAGNLFWKERPCSMFPSARAAGSWNARYSGKEAGADNGRGYICICVNGCTLKAHRVAWAIHYGEWPRHDVDHINHNRSDNRIGNLRDVERSFNNKNRPPQRNNTSRFVGVYWNKECRKWAAFIGIDGSQVHLGVHPCLGRAVKTRRAAERHYGFSKGHGGLV